MPNTEDVEDYGPERRTERRQSIDMPTLDDSEKQKIADNNKNEDSKKPESGEDDASVVSGDLELTDDDSTSSSSSGEDKIKEEKNSKSKCPKKFKISFLNFRDNTSFPKAHEIKKKDNFKHFS